MNVNQKRLFHKASFGFILRTSVSPVSVSRKADHQSAREVPAKHLCNRSASGDRSFRSGQGDQDFRSGLVQYLVEDFPRFECASFRRTGQQ